MKNLILFLILLLFVSYSFQKQSANQQQNQPNQHHTHSHQYQPHGHNRVIKLHWEVDYITFYPDGPLSAPKIALGVNNGTGYTSPGPNLSFNVKYFFFLLTSALTKKKKEVENFKF